MTAALTIERLREVLHYDAESGVFTWRKAISSHAVVGRPAGGLKPPKNYAWIRIDGRGYYAHRLAWAWMTGEWPQAEVDHRNGLRADNRWDNLRQASPSDNVCNRRRHRNNTSGFKGVTFHTARGRWHARITKDRCTESLGYFDSAVAAHAAYTEAAARMHGEYSRVV